MLDASGRWFGKQALSALQYRHAGFHHCAARESGPIVPQVSWQYDPEAAWKDTQDIDLLLSNPFWIFAYP